VGGKREKDEGTGGSKISGSEGRAQKTGTFVWDIWFEKGTKVTNKANDEKQEVGSVEGAHGTTKGN